MPIGTQLFDDFPTFQIYKFIFHNISAQYEYFKDPYGGVPKWIDDQTYYTFFTEGWGLYSENPVIAKDTDTYDRNPMQKYGMLKWQVSYLKSEW